MPRDRYEWTKERLTIFHSMYAAGGNDQEIAVALGTRKFVTRYKREGLGLRANGPRRRGGFQGHVKEPRQEPVVIPDRRDITGFVFGDPLPERSALAQKLAAPPAATRRVTLPSAASFLPVDHKKRNRSDVVRARAQAARAASKAEARA